MECLRPEKFFNLEGLNSAPLFENVDFVWGGLERLGGFIKDIIKPQGDQLRINGDLILKPAAILDGLVLWDNISYELGEPAKGHLKVFQKGVLLPGAALIMPGVTIADDLVEIGPGALVESGAFLNGPTIIGPKTEVRQGAYVRGQVMTGMGSVIGHVTEAKNVLMLDGAKAGHFAYLGDSILGRNVNLGAGTKLANFKILDTPITIKSNTGEVVPVNLRKLGAILGDNCSLGCNSVTNPGVIMGPGSLSKPNSNIAAGLYPARKFFK